MTARRDPADELAAALASDVVAILAGHALGPPAAPRGAELDALLERTGDGDVAPLRLLRLTAHAGALQERLNGVLLADRAPVLLNDGSKLSRTAAERKLAQKEERGPFTPLREALWMSTADGRLREQEAELVLRTFSRELGVEGALDDDEVARLEGWVKRLEQPALAALEVMGAAASPTAAGWARALDACAPERVTLERLRALTRALLDAASDHLVRPVRALVAPRALVGACLSAGPDVVLVPTAEILTMGKAADLLTASALGTLAALRRLNEDDGADDPHDATRSFREPRATAVALSRALSSPALRRRVLDEDARRATEHARIDAATRCLRTFLLCVAARAAAGGGTAEAVSEALFSTTGTRLDDATVHDLLRPSWPGGQDVPPAARELFERAAGELDASVVELGFRERFDELWATSPGFWSERVHEQSVPEESSVGDEAGAQALTTFVERLHELL